MLFNKDITIYSSYKEKGQDRYIKTLLPNSCFIDATEIINTNTNGIENADKILVLLPKVNCKNYISPKKFKELQNKESYFTIQKGDRIVKGLVQNEYSSITELTKHEENVYTITQIDDKDYGTVPHFEIAGK